MEFAKVRISSIGDCVYSIDVVYTHEHNLTECGRCDILVSRDTGRNYNGLWEVGKSLSDILETYAYEIRNSQLYTHARTITVMVYRGDRESENRAFVESHRITKGL